MSDNRRILILGRLDTFVGSNKWGVLISGGEGGVGVVVCGLKAGGLRSPYLMIRYRDRSFLRPDTGVE